jgi:hypothetical protein
MLQGPPSGSIPWFLIEGSTSPLATSSSPLRGTTTRSLSVHASILGAAGKVQVIISTSNSTGHEWILLQNQFHGKRVHYCDTIQYERLVFASTTYGTIFAWDPYCFGMFVFHHN